MKNLTIEELEGTGEWRDKIGKLTRDEYFLLVNGAEKGKADRDKLKRRIRKEILAETK